jgi:hypothetical protein
MTPAPGFRSDREPSEGTLPRFQTEAAYSSPSSNAAASRASFDQFPKYFIARDPQFTLNKFDVDAPGPWAQRVAELTPLINDTAAQLQELLAPV